MKRIISIYLFFILLICINAASGAGPPISYQGRLLDSAGNAIIDNIHQVDFFLYDANVEGNELWTETASITTYQGYFNHFLGSTTEIPDSLFENNLNLFLEVIFNSEIISPRIQLGASPFSKTSGGLNVIDQNDDQAIKTFSDEHKLVLYSNDENISDIIIQAGRSDDSALVLPDSAINSDEILNEAGLNYGISTKLIALAHGYMIDLTTVSIRTPADGYIVVQGKCYLLLSGTTNANRARIQIDEEPGGNGIYPYYTIAGLSGYVNTDINYFPIYVIRTFSKNAGTYQFRMEGEALDLPPANAETWDHILTATYYPTSYYPSFKSNSIDNINQNESDIDISERYHQAKEALDRKK